MKKILLFFAILLMLISSTMFSQELQWGEVQKVLSGDAEANDEFGFSVAISGNYAIVGAYHEGSEAGSAYIFELDEGSGTFTELQKLVASDQAVDDEFGRSVAISGTYSVIWSYK